MKADHPTGLDSDYQVLSMHYLRSLLDTFLSPIDHFAFLFDQPFELFTYSSDRGRFFEFWMYPRTPARSAGIACAIRAWRHGCSSPGCLHYGKACAWKALRRDFFPSRRGAGAPMDGNGGLISDEDL